MYLLGKEADWFLSGCGQPFGRMKPVSVGFGDKALGRAFGLISIVLAGTAELGGDNGHAF